MRLFFLFIGLVISSFSAFGQFSITGTVRDAATNQALPGVNVVAVSPFDSSRLIGTITDVSGKFEIKITRPGPYTIRFSFVGYEKREERVRLPREQLLLQMPPVLLKEDVKTLGEVRIEGVEQRVEQRGDTTEIRADAFKVNPDADAEQLVRKMPGITVENGQVQAQGEQVRRVLLDGQEFFGDDAMMALRNLPAEVVDRIQLIDRMSDQAQFTGFNDGNTEKTLNIITKSGLDNSRFGKLYAGYGTDNRYMSGGNMNFFVGKKRITLLGMANNINQQNFSSQDLGGLSNAAAGASRFGGGGGRGGGGFRPGGMGGGGESANFLTGQQGGISTTQAFGLNYSDNWGAKGKMSGSYFFNRNDNGQLSQTSRQFFLNDGIGQLYNESSAANSLGNNHRLNLRVEYNIDSNNSLIFTPRISWQRREQQTAFDGTTTNRLGVPINSTNNQQTNQTESWNVNGDVQYRHRFAKKGRTLSVNVNADAGSSQALRDLYALNLDGLMLTDSLLVNQEINSSNYTQRYRADVVFTEALSEKSMLEFTYAPQLTLGVSEQRANNFDPVPGTYSLVDTAISNDFDNLIWAQSAGLRYRYNTEKWEWMFGANYQISSLFSQQLFPRNLVANRDFYNWLPSAMFRYNFSKTANMRLFYRTNIDLPTLSQLQNVVDNSNTLQLRAGNPNLGQAYTHRIGMRFRDANVKKGTSSFVFVNLSLVDGQIANSTFIAPRDTLLPEGVVLVRGAQLIRPVNVAGAYNFRTFGTYGFPLKAIRSNLNVNVGYTFNNSPTLINAVTNEARTHNLNTGFTLGSNISKDLDFTLGYSLNYNTVFNSIQPQLNNNYYIHNGNFRINWLPIPALVFSSDVLFSAFAGLEEGFNQQFTLWNAGVGYRFGKDRRAELKLSVFDLLNQNNSIARNVTETYVEDVQTVVLQQFWMMTFTYNVRHFRKA